MEGKAVCKSNKITRTPGASNIGGSDTKGKQVGTGNLQKVKTNKETAIGGIFWSGSTSEGSIKEGHSDQCSLTTKGVRPRSGWGEMRRVKASDKTTKMTQSGKHAKQWALGADLEIGRPKTDRLGRQIWGFPNRRLGQVQNCCPNLRVRAATLVLP